MLDQTGNGGSREGGSRHEMSAPLLDAERIEERALILHDIDAQSCQGCGRPAPPEVASDPGWYIENYMDGRDAAGEPVVLAYIRCPECF